MWKKVFEQLILPVLFATIFAMLFKPIYIQDGVINYFLAWILIGFPFGIRKMFFILIPSKYDLGGTIGVMVLNIIVGGIIGGFVLIADIILGSFNLLKLVISGLKSL